MRCAAACLFIVAAGTLSAQVPLKPALRVGLKYSYRVDTVETDYEGASATVVSEYDTITPILVEIVSASATGANLSVTSGPLVIKGRSVGRAKISRTSVDAGNARKGFAASLLSVALPPTGIKVGQKWRSGISGPAPLAGGLTAEYRFTKVIGSGAKRFAQIDMTLDAYAASKIHGNAQFFLRLSDGYLDHGTAKFEIAYLRPDQKDPKRLNVNSHMTLSCTVSPG